MLDFKNMLLMILKIIILAIIIFGIIFLCIFDYHLGVKYCSFMNIPTDFAISVVSPGMAVEVCIVLFVFEIIGLYFLVKLLRKNKYVDNFCGFLCFDI